MKNITLNLRNNNPPEIFKSIRVIGNSPERFIGDFRYIRLSHDGYDTESGDLLDNQILKSIKSLFPESYILLNMLVLFDKQYDDCLKMGVKGITKNILTYFYPIVNYQEQVPTDLKAYFLEFYLNLAMSENDPRLNYISSNLVVNLPYKQLNDLIKTIKPI